jgi:signal transduction histidine kinase
MRYPPSPNLLDWVSSTLRWLILFGLTISLATGGILSLEVEIILLISAAWSLCLTALAVINRRFVGQSYVTVGVDALIAGLLFTFSGGLGGSCAWAGLLPVASAAMYFHERGAAIASLAFTLVQAAISLAQSNLTTVALALVPLGLFYLLFGLLLGYFSGRMRGFLEKAQEEALASRREVARAERERIRSLYKLISALGATLNYQRVLDTAMDIGYSTLAITDGGSEHMVSAVLLYSQDEAKNTELKVGSARRFTAADMRISLPGKDGLVGRSIDQGTAQMGKGLAKDAELSRIVALRKCRASYCIPLRTGLDTYGVLLFAHPDEDFFTSERREILDIIGGQAVIALQNARLYRDLEQEKERITEIQEEARKKLARDLHDGPTQSVAALAMRVNFARRLMEKDPKTAADELYKVEELARRTTKEIRHMLFTLRPLVLESQGLVAALESMAEKMKDTYNQTVIIEADADTVSQLEVSKQGVIFYIAEEAVNNARKHAQAVHVWVRLKWAGDDLALLEIEDDGVGFDVAAVDENYDNRGSLGMVNMRERAELVNSFLNIETVEGRGTHITLLIPLTEDAADRVRRGG